MEYTGQAKQSESGSRSRPGLRSRSAHPIGELSSMGQTAMGSLTNGHELPSSTVGVDEVASERSRRTSERNTGAIPTVSVRSSCSTVGKDHCSEKATTQLDCSDLHTEKSSRSRPSSTEGTRHGKSSICLHCGASLDGGRERIEFRELWQMQLDMIDEQRATLLEREAELQQLREAKTKVETRLTRMERRLTMTSSRDHLSVGNDNSLAPASPASPLNTATTTQTKLCSSGRAHLKRSHGSATTSRSPSPCPRGDKAGKRTRASAPGHLTTNVLYDAPTQAQFTSALSRANEPEADRGDVVKVPSWRCVDDDLKVAPGAVRRSSGGKDAENLSDDAFLQRHSKHEQEEKRIKRWDMQRMRKQREHEKLLKRYEEKEVRWHKQGHEENCEVVNSFLPPLEHIETIELTDELPVTAFGRLVPRMPRTTFSLPWFDPTKHGAEGEPRKTRSKSRSRAADACS